MTSLQGTSILLYGPTKIGKTTFLASFPQPHIVYATERRHKHVQDQLSIVELYSSADWVKFKKHITTLKKLKPKTVSIDTVADLYYICFGYVCEQEGCSHPGDKGDYGRAIWHKIRMHLYQALGDLIGACADLGATIIFVCQETTKKVETRARDRIVTKWDLPFQLEDKIPPKVENIWRLGKEESPDISQSVVRRELTLSGDEYMEAETGLVQRIQPHRVPLTSKQGDIWSGYAVLEKVLSKNGESK